MMVTFGISLSVSAKVEKALKVAVVLTIPAAGSEGSGNTVITKTETLQKLGLVCPRAFASRIFHHES